MSVRKINSSSVYKAANLDAVKSINSRPAQQKRQKEACTIRYVRATHKGRRSAACCARAPCSDQRLATMPFSNQFFARLSLYCTIRINVLEGRSITKSTHLLPPAGSLDEGWFGVNDSKSPKGSAFASVLPGRSNGSTCFGKKRGRLPFVKHGCF